MKSWRVYVSNLTIVVLGSILSTCTSNPAGQDDISLGRRQIRGQVILNDGADPQGVYVWLNGQELWTQTDNEGNFKVTLPVQPEQEAGRGQIEQDTLYFYLANYLLEQAAVTIVEGEFLYSRGDINEEGQVLGPIVLRRFMDISTSVRPSIASGSSATDTVSVMLRIEADITCASAINPFILVTDNQRNAGDGFVDTLGVVLIKNLNSEDVLVVRSDPTATGNEILVPCKNDPIFRELLFVPSEVQLPSGQYEIIPYLLINPVGVPQGLLDLASIPFNNLGADYLKKPMRRRGGLFEVRN